MAIAVIRIPAGTRRFLALLPCWRETLVASGNRIARHSHRFFAVYFAFDVPFLDTGGALRSLPLAAIVLVPPRALHGWVGSNGDSAGTVGHFHRGHPAYLTERIATEAACR